MPHAALAVATRVVVALGIPERRPEGVMLRAELLDAASGQVVERAQGRVRFGLDGALVGSADLSRGAAELLVPVLPVGRITAWYVGDGEAGAAGVA